MAAITMDTRAEIMVVYFTEGRLLDTQLVRRVGKELHAAVGQSLHRKLLLNFDNVSYLASTMISELIVLNNACKVADVDLKFCDVRSNIAEVFRITNLHKLIDIEATEDAALKSFGKKRFLG